MSVELHEIPSSRSVHIEEHDSNSPTHGAELPRKFALALEQTYIINQAKSHENGLQGDSREHPHRASR